MVEDGEGEAGTIVVGDGNAQTVAAHEAGHMFGLDDEYTGGGAYGAGKKTEHTDFAAAAGHTGAMHAKSDSIMSEGSLVRPHHYVTFLDALKQVSGMPDWDYGAAKPVKEPDGMGDFPGAGHAGRRRRSRRPLLPDTPEPLLLERRVETGDDVYVDRITADGGVWTGGTVTAEISRRRVGVRHPRTELAARDDAPAGRRRGAPCGDHRLGLLRHARGVPPGRRRDPRLAGGLDRRLDGRRHTSTLQARGTTQAEPLTKLAAALEGALEAGE